ncbi:MAG TPA: hypothetical protein VHV83_01775 [Armatimonadota bacterium]|nr:hypothetical protein [Armatimonadota bacterium]
MLGNPHWFATAGTIEPSRRQWYSTYFVGRVTTAGEFKPLTVYGYDSQGSVGPKITQDEAQQYYRTEHFITRVRPDTPTGVGLVVSWAAHEKRMGAVAGRLGFGLYAANGQDQIDTLAGAVYHRLVENGVPITFVTSTYALRKWKGTAPLIVVDGGNLEKWELDELDRLCKAGTPIIAIGAATDSVNIAATGSLYGVKCANQQWAALPNSRVVKTDDHDIVFVSQKPGSGTTVFCPTPGSALTNTEYTLLAKEIFSAIKNPIELSPGVTAFPFISNDRLFLSLNDQGDVNREIRVAVRPSLLKSDMTGNALKVIDMDRATVVPARWEADQFVFTIPVAASDGRMIMIVKE